MDIKSFKLIDIEKVKRPFLIIHKNLSQFELSLDEEIVCLCLNELLII